MMKKIMVLMLVVLFTGVSLTGPTSANADCKSCCKTCQAKYNAAVGRIPTIWDILNISEVETESTETCFALALSAGFMCCAAFGGCDGFTQAAICLGSALVVFWQCEAPHARALSSCQASCPCCSGC